MLINVGFFFFSGKPLRVCGEFEIWLNDVEKETRK